MKIEIRNPVRFVKEVDVPLYNRGDALAIDFNNCKSQILLSNISKAQARNMIREIEAFIEGGYKLDESISAEDCMAKFIPSAPSRDEWDFIKKGMEEYRRQGRYYTADEIRKIQEQAYEQGFNSGRDTNQ